MSDLLPLLREGADDLERQLLESGRDDRGGGDAARARTLAAARAALHAGAVAGVVGVAGWRWASNIGLTTARALWLSGVVSVLALGSASLLSTPTHDVRPTPSPPVVGAVKTDTPSSRIPSAAPSTRTAADERTSAPPTTREAAAVHPPMPATEATVAPATLAVPTRAAPPMSALLTDTPEGQPQAPSSLSAPSVTSTGATPAPATPPSLARETALLESANAALATSQPSTALARLDAYDAEFPAGVLAEDGQLLRVKTLVALGRRAEAGRVADAFERRFPASAYVSRIRGLVPNNP